MDLNQAKLLLQENNANSSYDIYVPSYKKHLPFKHMTVGQYKSMAKAAIEGLEKLDQFFSALMEELSHGEVSSREINKVDKLYILAGIKYKNANPQTDITLKCRKCESALEDVNILENLDNTIEFKTETIEYKIGELDVKMVISLPSVYDEIEFELYIKDIFEKTEEKAEYERKLLNIRSICINGNEIDDWLDYSVTERLHLLDNISSDYFDLATVNDCIFEQLKTTIVDIECSKCGTKNKYISSPEDFFLF